VIKAPSHMRAVAMKARRTNHNTRVKPSWVLAIIVPVEVSAIVVAVATAIAMILAVLVRTKADIDIQRHLLQKLSICRCRIAHHG